MGCCSPNRKELEQKCDNKNECVFESQNSKIIKNNINNYDDILNHIATNNDNKNDNCSINGIKMDEGGKNE